MRYLIGVVMSKPFICLFVIAGLLTCALVHPVAAQNGTAIPDTEAMKHVGQQVTIEGTVSKVFKSKNGNTFLDFGGSYPDVTFVVWIPEDAPEAADTELSGLQDKKVKVSGTVELYRGKPEIKVSAKEQIVIE
jgi:DNA/RNA endonuclease YhcR with UshA esterase domain